MSDDRACTCVISDGFAHWSNQWILFFMFWYFDYAILDPRIAAILSAILWIYLSISPTKSSRRLLMILIG